jgi:methyltransferase (TIGR00027 family)
MLNGLPSRTALAAACHRAAHQVLEGGRIFKDPLALPILGDDADRAVAEAEAQPDRRFMRMFIAVRHRFTEDALAAAVECGVRQAVVLGAGLDTCAYRSAINDRLRFFEVDHPATQEWKRSLLAEAGIPIPPSLRFVPIDFERETMAEGLEKAEFDPGHPTFFMWLGVVPYLTPGTVWSTLEFVRRLAAHVVFDYSDPPETFSPEMRAAHDRRAARVAEIGEPWINYFDPPALHSRLKLMGFRHIEDLGPREIAARYLPEANVIRERGGHVLHASSR